MTQPSRTNPSRDAFDKIADEHQALEEYLGRLDRTSDPKVLLPRLEKLRGLLEHHFEGEEEAEGIRDDVAKTAPYLLGGLERVFAEHEELLQEVDALHAKAREVLEGPVAELRSAVSLLARRLRDHEVRETEFMTEVFNTDYGEGS